MNYKSGHTKINFAVVTLFSLIVIGLILWPTVGLSLLNFSSSLVNIVQPVNSNSVVSTPVPPSSPQSPQQGQVAPQSQAQTPARVAAPAQSTNNSDLAVKEVSAEVSGQAEFIYNTNKSYDTACQDPEIVQLSGSINSMVSGGVECNGTSTAWAFQVPLPSGGYWCVDAQGDQKDETSKLVLATSCL